MAFKSLKKTLFVCAVAASAIAMPLAASAQSGIASVYSRWPYGKRRTDCRPGAMTAAHRTLPFGTMVRVTNNRTGRSVVVRINDRGPFVHGRVIDLTPGGGPGAGLSPASPP